MLHRLAREGSPANRAQAVAVCLPGVFLVLVFTHPVPSASEGVVLTVLLASLAPAAALAGVARRARDHARLHDAARQAAAGDLLEHAARGERTRIARELHDVVAHHISMIAVQAETARMATPGMPAAGAQRLSAIGDTAGSALTEMRRLLGILREDAQTDDADLRPQPGLEQLNELLDQTRDASGSAARLILSGAPVALGPGVELAAYRIVQEALTNARRHAPGVAVDVELRYTDRARPAHPRHRTGAAGANTRWRTRLVRHARTRHSGRRRAAHRRSTRRRLPRRGNAPRRRKPIGQMSLRIVIADDHEVVRSGLGSSE